MSTPTKGRSKRALPSVPLERATSVDRIVTGTPKSARNISKRVDVEPACVDVIKSRNFASQHQHQQMDGPNMNSKLRSELCSKRKDLSSSESGSNTSSPYNSGYNSPRETRKATVAPMVAQIIDKFSQESNSTDRSDTSFSTEKKIARVLPMTPHFLEEHITNPANEPLVTKHGEESIANLKITNLQSALVEGNNNNDEVKTNFTPSTGSKNVLDVFQAKLAGTPSSVSTTPQRPPVDDGEGSSVRVGVRVRPFLPRYKLY